MDETEIIPIRLSIKSIMTIQASMNVIIENTNDADTKAAKAELNLQVFADQLEELNGN